MFLRGLTSSTGKKGLVLLGVLLRLVAAPQEDFHVVCKGRVDFSTLVGWQGSFLDVVSLAVCGAF